MKPKTIWAVLIASSLAYAGMLLWVVLGQTSVSLEPAVFVWALGVVPSMVVAGAIVLWKRPSNRIGHLLIGAGLTSFVFPTLVEIPTLVAHERSGVQDWMWAPMWVFTTFTAVGIVLIIALIVLMPDGRVRYRRERTLLRYSWIVVLFPTFSLLSNEHVITDTQAFPGIEEVPSPLVFEVLRPFGDGLGTLAVLAYLLILVAIGFQFVRYRRAPLREKKQVRWVLFAGGLAAFWGLAFFTLEQLGVINLSHGSLGNVLSVVPIILFPASVMVAVLEPKWVDVDIVIRKSFVYGALSFVILLAYIAVAAAFGLAAGSRLQVEVAIFLTVVVAILFQPARRWLQNVADRWVFGERPSTEEAVAAFGATIEEASDPAEAVPRLADTLQRALRLEWVEIELDGGSVSRLGEVHDEPVLSVPIASGNQRFGQIRCGPRVEGQLSDEGKQVVHTLAGQMALAVANARLAGRIVTAAEEERRRIERNIHDGAQQELVALVARLGMARAKASGGSLAPEELAELQTEAQRILADLRDLAQGIHPSVLTDGGILEAVEERCAHVPLNVRIEATPDLRARRFPDDIEGAAYFFVTEALTNVLKHAEASRAVVSIEQDDGELRMAVADDGHGFDLSQAPLNGLAGLHDRLHALGGTVEITSSDSGTTVAASLPVATT